MTKLVDELKDKLDCDEEVEYYQKPCDSDSYTGYYISSNPGLVIDIDGIGRLGDDDTVCIDLVNGDFYGGVHDLDDLPNSIIQIFKWYKNQVKYGGDGIMSKKEINEAIGEDIQKLASDLTKKREMDKANSSAEDIAKKLGVKLPKSKK